MTQHSANPATTPARRWRRYGLGLLLLAVAVLAACTLWPKPAASTQWLTQPVSIGELEQTVTAQGALAPRDYVDVGAQVSGQLSRVYVAIGEQVKKGQLLAQIDPEVYQTRVAADQAAVADLQAQLEQQQVATARARQLLARQTALAKVDATTNETLEQAQAGFEQARAGERSLQAQLAKAQATLKGDAANLGYTRIYAPLDGTVVSQTVLQGQTINASQSAPTLLRVARLDTMTVEAEVAEADIPLLRPGMAAYFTTLGDSQTRHAASIRQIKPTPTTSNDVVLYTVLLDVANPGHKLMIDMTAQVFFSLAKVSGLPVVPLTALQPLAAGGKRYRAQVLNRDGQPETREVEVALLTRSQAAIRSGLRVGEQLVLAQQSDDSSKVGSSKVGSLPPPPGG